jgi:LysM repeat protein
MRKIAFVLLLAVAGTAIAGSGAHADSSSSNQTKTSNQPKTHIVVSGESLSSIAADNNLPSWMPLWDVNAQIQNPDQINVGEQLVIPTAPYPTTDRPLPPGYGAPAPAPTPVVSSAPVAQVTGSPGGLAQRVCARESGCNYAENTGNGYYGAYQFDNGTWADFDGYASANLAPPAVQDAKFQQEYAARGCSPWPNTCY